MNYVNWVNVPVVDLGVSTGCWLQVGGQRPIFEELPSADRLWRRNVLPTTSLLAARRLLPIGIYNYTHTTYYVLSIDIGETPCALWSFHPQTPLITSFGDSNSSRPPRFTTPFTGVC